MNRIIHPIFSTPLYTSTIKINGSWISCIKNLSYKRTSMNNGWISESESLFNLPELKDLHEKIQEEVNYFAYETLGVSENVSLNIIRSWAVKHKQKDWGQRHCHTNCLFSGIYYLEVNPKSGDISFEGNSCFQTSSVPNLKHFNQFTSESLNITPKSEYIFIFPSHLVHSVGVNISMHERYCLSFDVGVA